ncbi:hypothetical protein NCC49_005914 [Naganishia albida]|nr:hypothetical protein NCC49_005914 [Naganishia albida]
MRFIPFLLGVPLLAYAAPAPKRWDGAEACEYIATQVLNDPHDVVSCLKSFPFREELRQNVMAVADSVMDFYTFETTAISSPSPFEDTKVDIRQEFERIKTQDYDTDYDFNVDLYFTVNRLNDGHTLWIPNCYVNVFQNLLPIPIVSLAKTDDSAGYSTSPTEAVYVIPDANEFFSPFLNGSFHKYFEDKGIDVKRLEGAEVVSIDGQDPYAYVNRIAEEYSGGYLSRDIRQSMAYSSYRFADSAWGQRLGAFAGPIVPDYPSGLEVTVTLIPRDTHVAETVTIQPFWDQQSFWSVNCEANLFTNGIDLKPYLEAVNGTSPSNLTDTSRAEAIDLPRPFVPTSPNLTGSNDATYFTMLPHTSVGVMVLGSFYPRNLTEWRRMIMDGLANLKTEGADYLIVDVTNNPGGYVCGQFLMHRILAGSSVDRTPGFEGVIRANELGRQMMGSNIELAKLL